MWLVATAIGLLLWVVAFSWWAPGPFFPVIVVVIVLIIAFGRRQLRNSPAPVSLSKESTEPHGSTDPHQTTDPSWAGDLRSWVTEAKEARRRRSARAFPVKVTTLITLLVTIIVLGVVDGATGIPLVVYFWSALGIVGAGLVIGMALRRTPWSVTGLLIPIVVGTVAFAGSSASLHDGTGQRDWTPTGTPAAQYRLAFGDATLDLSQLPTPTAPRTIHITMAAGRVIVVAPPTLNVRVEANVHLGDVETSDYLGDGLRSTHSSGAGLRKVISPRNPVAGPRITVVVDLADGQVRVDRSS